MPPAPETTTRSSRRPDPASRRPRASHSTTPAEDTFRAPRSATKKATTKSRSPRTTAARSTSIWTRTTTSSARRPTTKAPTTETGPTTIERFAGVDPCKSCCQLSAFSLQLLFLLKAEGSLSPSQTALIHQLAAVDLDDLTHQVVGGG